MAGVGGMDLTPWGKALKERGVVYPLLFHLLDTAAIAAALWEEFLAAGQRARIAEGLGVSEGEARRLVAFWAGLHDVGKLSPGFQRCVPWAYEGVSAALRRDVGVVERMGHARASMFSVFGPLARLGYGTEGRRRGASALRVAEILGGHHGRFQNADPAVVGGERCVEGLGGESWEALRRDYVAVVHRQLGEPAAPRGVESPVAVVVTGLVILADWLASQEHYWVAKGVSGVSAAEHFGAALAGAGEVIAQAGLARVGLVRQSFARLHGVGEANPLQRSVMEELPGAVSGAGILVVTAAPGDGKTETALEAERVLSRAAGSCGVCFVLPTMATSDAMYKRVASVVARQSPGGGSAVTLTHSMAWLNEAYSDVDLASGSRVVSHEDGEGEWAVTRPGEWLRGSKRALLAQYAVGTFDQALLSVLPVRHNCLRLLGLTGKTFVVDEAHAYEPYERQLLQRLLSWLGWFRCPVVLLSATLPSQAADQLVRAYLRGAGHRKVRGESFSPGYPGWLFADAETARTTRMSGERRKEHQAYRAVRLAVEVKAVTHRSAGDAGRLAVIERELEPLLAGRGAAAVVCSTVADAQATYLHLRDRAGLRAGEELLLLHSQLPGQTREERAGVISRRLGRGGRGAGRMVVVATQVIEQSLDLDVDVVVSDLAPVSQLLQRAGRCWRHEHFWRGSGRPEEYRVRPGWCRGPRLVVLNPLGGRQEPPRHWGGVYPEYLLAATAEVLSGLPGGVVDVPQGIQSLVERVHVQVPEGAEEKRYAQYLQLQGEILGQEQVGRCAAVPPPWELTGLHAMHRETLDEVRAATRLGAESVRVVYCFRQADGVVTFDRAGQEPLPGQQAAGGLSAGDVRAVMRRTIPVRATYLSARGPEHAVPGPWAQQPLLGEVVLLVNEEPEDAGSVVAVGPVRFGLDPELGLVRQ